jgi:hypothetical protein
MRDAVVFVAILKEILKEIKKSYLREKKFLDPEGHYVLPVGHGYLIC